MRKSDRDALKALHRNSGIEGPSLVDDFREEWQPAAAQYLAAAANAVPVLLARAERLEQALRWALERHNDKSYQCGCGVCAKIRAALSEGDDAISPAGGADRARVSASEPDRYWPPGGTSDAT